MPAPLSNADKLDKLVEKTITDIIDGAPRSQLHRQLIEIAAMIDKREAVKS
jgi:hypothetical protein